MKLQVDHITLSYDGTQILRDLNLSVEAGEFVSIVGPSGCGKSTLLSVIAGTLPAQEGQVCIDGLGQRGVSSRTILMPQDDLLLPWMRILDNVCLYGKIHGDLAALRKRAREELAFFGLEGYENHYPHELSGGMRQRAAFLRTALCPADILLLDEPFAALDVITREEMRDWLLQLRARLGRTVLLVTHDIDEAIYLSDRVLVLAGRPAGLQKALRVPDQNRNRAWLLSQSLLKQELYEALKGERSDASF